MQIKLRFHLSPGRLAGVLQPGGKCWLTWARGHLAGGRAAVPLAVTRHGRPQSNVLTLRQCDSRSRSEPEAELCPRMAQVSPQWQGSPWGGCGQTGRGGGSDRGRPKEAGLALLFPSFKVIYLNKFIFSY